MDDPEIIIRIAVPADVKYVYTIIEEMERSAIARGTGIARRSPQSICQKIYEGKAVRKVRAEIPAIWKELVTLKKIFKMTEIRAFCILLFRVGQQQ